MDKVCSFKIKGMLRDLSVSSFSAEYAYENMNVRIMPTNELTLFSIVNEKGTKLCQYTLLGIPIGLATIDKYLIVFSHDEHSNKSDKITKISIDSTNLLDVDIDILYEGNLNFDPKCPIETLSFYENSDIMKVYWTDGKNLPRFINIASSEEIRNKWNDSSFDFITLLTGKESVSITKINSGGLFSSGVVLYAFTYYNKYGLLSNIFYISSLYYVSPIDNGAAPSINTSNSFKISILNVDLNFDYIRVYQILRTTIDSTPLIKYFDITTYNEILPTLDNIKLRYKTPINPGVYTITLRLANPVESVGGYYVLNPMGIYSSIIFPDNTEKSILNAHSITLEKDPAYLYVWFEDHTILYPNVFTIDNGTIGESVEETLLLYVGGNVTTFGALTLKDNTLFLGNININKKILDTNLRNSLKRVITFEDGSKIQLPKLGGYYGYFNLLNSNSTLIKTFKYLEYYRFGILFLDKWGIWSDPVWVGDYKNTHKMQTSFTTEDSITLTKAVYELDNKGIIDILVSNKYNFIKARPVIVFPGLLDREIVCLGVLCPTVYSTLDRFSNTPFALSSWFTRPNAPFLCVEDEGVTDINKGWVGFDSQGKFSVYSRGGIMVNSKVSVTSPNTKTIYMDSINKGAWAEFRHNYPIPSSLKRNAEILCLYSLERLTPFLPPLENGEDYTDYELLNYIQKYNNYFYVDLSIVTLHSPDIEFDTLLLELNTNNLKLRVVGIVPITGNNSYIDISTSTGILGYYNNPDVGTPPGFYKESIASINEKYDSMFGWRSLINGAFWYDLYVMDLAYWDKGELYKSIGDPTGFIVYPWHRNGSLNNAKYLIEGTRSAMLEKKILTNYKYSYNSLYLITNEEIPVSDIKVFNSTEVANILLQIPYGDKKINYYGNVDKLITFPQHILDLAHPYSMRFITKHTKLDGYPIFTTNIFYIEKEESKSDYYHNIFTDNLTSDTDSVTDQYKNYFIGSYNCNSSGPLYYNSTGVDPVRMRYKSSPHYVVALGSINNLNKYIQYILPTVIGEDTTGNKNIAINYDTYFYSQRLLFWDKNKEIIGTHQDVIDLSLLGVTDIFSDSVLGILHGFLWLGELYRDNIDESIRFGGNSLEALEKNIWIPCGQPVSLINDVGLSVDKLVLNYTEGDTYFLRYDHLKTYSFSSEDQNLVTEVISFMCETRVNIDGRYDKNRGNPNLTITPETFNKLNSVYTLTNNYFKYRIPNPNKLNLNNFHNSITWTKTKTLGELIDSWTNITLASTLDLDGDKGPVRSLKRFNNNLFAFQDRGISQILYNDNVLIASTQGVPIEIANSGKVSGKRYLTEVGCTNKWSICLTPSGLYFIDDITKGIYLFNGLLNNLSDKLGFHSWINSESKSTEPWNPVDFLNFVSYYDKVNGDVFFISKDKCLGFSEPLGLFVSFYNYENTPYFANIQDKGIWIKLDGTLWMHLEGEYNNFFGENKPFYTTIIANPDPLIDKTFNTVEFRADSFKNNKFITTRPFDTLKVWNEYLSGISNFDGDRFAPKNPLRLKFRMWRANIPRSNENYRDRIRNPWAYILLINKGETTNKVLLHDIVVHYFQ